MIPNLWFYPVVGRPFAITIYMIQVYHYPVKYEVFGVNRKSRSAGDTEEEYPDTESKP